MKGYGRSHLFVFVCFLKVDHVMFFLIFSRAGLNELNYNSGKLERNFVSHATYETKVSCQKVTVAFIS